jgi:sugar lactone lactonase YvrE
VQLPPDARGQFFAPTGVALVQQTLRVNNDFLNFEYLLVADTLNSTIRKVETSTGLVTTLFGTPGVEGSTSTLFRRPTAVVLDGFQGDYLVVDTGNNTIRSCCLDFDTLLPGSPVLAGVANTPGYAEGSPGLFNQPGGIAVDYALNILYVADTGNSVIRRITYDDDGVAGTSLVAGTPGQPGFADAANGTAAKFNRPTGVAFDRLHNRLYVADTGNHVIRAVDVSGGGSAAVSTVAGSPGVYGYRDGARTAALFAQPVSVSVEWPLTSLTPTSLLVGDRASYTVRRIAMNGAAFGDVTTVAGVAWERGSADGTAATARLRAPSGLVYVPNPVTNLPGATYVVDTGNNLVRTIRQDGQGVSVSTLTGIRQAGSADGWPAGLDIGAPKTIACAGTRLFIDGKGVHRIDLDPDANGGVAQAVASTDWSGFVYAANTNTLYRALAYSIEYLVLQTGLHGTFTSVDNTAEDNTHNLVTTPTDLFWQFTSFDLGGEEVFVRGSDGGHFLSPLLGRIPTSDGAFLYSYGLVSPQIERIDTSTQPFTTATIAVPSLGNDKPASLAVAGGSAYITTVGRHDVRRIDLATGAVTTLAGSATTADAPFENPSGLCVIGGNLFVADTGNGVVRRVDIASGATVPLALRLAP